MLNGHSRNNYARSSLSLKLESTGHIGDDLYDKVAAQFPRRELADLTLAIIAINGWNRVAVPFHKEVTLTPIMEEAA
jgi:hypothetical protein